ncbi:MAG: Lrp/AsnC family transcriptional regulator [Burkholderiaceae bacterium]|nr:Lrp/AsnC family transcriptional regulator [Rhodoferax sp.]MCB2040869.1 Lrp/AsnC family transcriptional regulator [Rhodoferax sp.]MCP5261763.1 Lrp/AsnC family transcriptional regulator [Rhodoferax sp.]MCW5642845.1 Lrp/AsnC family transcriptional regulator [Rhodoferax sp.]
MQTIELDRTDLRMLAFLQLHGRASNLELAEAVNLSTSQCHRRHRRLEEIGVITGYETRLDANQLGLGVTAFVHVSMEKGHMANLRKFTDAIRALPEVLECFSVTGDFDYVLKVMARDLKALSQFLMDTLMTLPSVDNVRSSVCLDRIKSTGALPLPG